MKDKISVMTWNINQRANYGMNSSIPCVVLEELEKVNCDITVLTEFYKVKEYKTFFLGLDKLGYIVVSNKERAKRGVNEVVIAIKKNVFDGQSLSVSQIETIYDFQPNMLNVQIKFKETVLNIVGVRIRPTTNWSNRREQLEFLTTYIQSLKGKVIVLGDFNNGYFSESDTEVSFVGNRKFYNYPYIKNEMSRIGFISYTPQKGFSWDTYRLDHIFAKNMKVINLSYNWEFETNKKFKKEVGFPDHAILLGELLL